MREDSRRGAPRQSRAAGRSGAGRDVRGRPTSDMRGRPAIGRGGPSGSRPGGDSARAAAASRPAAATAADVARLTSLIEPVLMAMEIDLETVKLASAGRRRVLRIIARCRHGWTARTPWATRPTPWKCHLLGWNAR
jgi:hypothetical protein